MRTVAIDNLDNEVRISAGLVGIVVEVAASELGVMKMNHVVLPQRPLPAASRYPTAIRVMSRKLIILDPGESYRTHCDGLWTSSVQIISNDGGRAKIERGGLSRILFGRGTKYAPRS